jgi:hypothetical protein
MPAKWLGCDNCTGQALGAPLVYRTSGQIEDVREELAAARPDAVAARDARREKARQSYYDDLVRGWDGCVFIGVTAGRAKINELDREDPRGN